ncbi:MAG: hypothetical protein AVDCRST_MAG20-2182 [uncultured Acidimicrobiales bacterium]|uniref:Alginate lyase domain-containing protein n=1 Tax=uncultured Acidimicrobiales bacterium TaxID=310071 RepID=A0A6J4IDX2_9ACTN|nr:MAG: hypothetical protein AVDCRST_MAG20-2182 [uncultured Acidimicrobiales bacterium]
MRRTAKAQHGVRFGIAGGLLLLVTAGTWSQLLPDPFPSGGAAVEATSAAGSPTTVPVARAAAWDATREPVEGIWISRAELAPLARSGAAWERVKAAADGDLGVATVADFNANHDVRTLAVALVYGATGDETYRSKAAEAIMAVIGTEAAGEAVMLGRNVVSYVIAADLIDLASFDPAREAAFRAWIDQARTRPFPDRTMIENDELRTNNHGRVAGAARAAIAVYLDDQAELDRTARVFKGFLGDQQAHVGFEYKNGVTWQSDPDEPSGIVPVDGTKDGHLIDGALPEEMRRGCDFQWPPCPTGYPWEGLGGVVVEAEILSRAGYDAWEWEDRAILRSVTFLDRLERQHGQWWAAGDDTWQPWLLNEVYDTTFPTLDANIGKNMGWTDWMYQQREGG